MRTEYVCDHCGKHVVCKREKYFQWSSSGDKITFRVWEGYVHLCVRCMRFLNAFFEDFIRMGSPSPDVIEED